ncbi:MAG: DUF1573 domain-containing protein, partial [Bacteroidota bacterium]
ISSAALNACSAYCKSGQKTTLKVYFDTTGRRANQYKSVSIFSNDPLNPSRILTIKGTIQETAN